MRILFTGRTGFFGKALLRHILSSENCESSEIVILSRRPERFLRTFPEFSGHSRLTFLQGDIQQPASLPWSQPFTHVLHAATDSTYGARLTPLQRYEQIVDGTKNILELAIATGVRRLLLTSSGAIYGSQPAEMTAMSEDWSGNLSLAEPVNSYGQAKRAAEYLCTLYGNQYELECVIARCFAFVGPDLPLDAHFAIGNFIHDALTADQITVTGDGSSLRTYLNQTDLAHWLLTLLDRGRPGQAYNVGSDEVISIAELAHLVRDILAPDKPVVILGKSDFSSSRHRYIPDIRKIHSELGLSVTVPIADAISRSQ